MLTPPLNFSSVVSDEFVSVFAVCLDTRSQTERYICLLNTIDIKGSRCSHECAVSVYSVLEFDSFNNTE